MCQAVSGQVVKDHFIAATLSLGTDPIPNIRFNVAKALALVIPTMKQTDNKIVQDQIKPLLLKMKDDTDLDVRFYAQKALSAF